MGKYRQQLSRSALKQLVAAGQEEQALAWILDHIDDQEKELQTLVILTSNKLKKLQQRMLIGNLPDEKIRMEKAGINHTLLSLIDDLDIPETSPADQAGSDQYIDTPQLKQQAKPKTRVKSKMLRVVLPVVVLAGLVLGLFSWFGPLGKKAQYRWEGFWELEIEAKDNVILKGTLKLTETGYKITGNATFIHPNGKTFENELYGIQLLENRQLMMGSWKYTDKAIRGVNLRGGFEFRLNKGSKKFKGKYTLINEENKKYFWNGTRKK